MLYHYNWLFISGFVFVILCAWCSMGAIYPDEHFMVLEFCSHKMGNPSANSYCLPWEYFAKARGTLLPDIAYIIAQILKGCNLYNPFTLAFLLRLLAGLSSWYISCRYFLLFAPSFKTTLGGKLFILMGLFLWFVPYIAVRYSSENLSGVIFLYGAYFILGMDERKINILLRYFMAGLFLGISFWVRIQMAPAVAGFVAWLLFIDKSKGKYILALVFSFMVAMGINILLDSWYYGAWTLAPYNYYYADIIQHLSKHIGGETPVWFFISDFMYKAIPPLSCILLVMFITGIYKNLKNPFVWAFIPFFAAHHFIAQKELRFLFPFTFVFIYLTALGFDYFLTLYYYQKIHKYVYGVCLVISIPLLLYKTLSPVQLSMLYNKFLYNYPVRKNTPVFYAPNRILDLICSANTSFYKNPNLKTVLIDSLKQMSDYIRIQRPETALFYYERPPGTLLEQSDWNGYQIKMIYCCCPSWLLKYAIDYGKDNLSIFSIYQFTLVDTANVFDVNKLLRDTGSFRNPATVAFNVRSAYSLIQNGRAGDAEKILITTEEKNPDMAIPHLHNYLGMIYNKSNRTADAEKEFYTEIAMNLQKEESWLNLGAIYFGQHDYTDAIKSMNNTLLINPNNFYAYHNLGVFYSSIQKDTARALSYFVKSVAINPNFKPSYLNIWKCAQNGRYDESLKYIFDNRRNLYTSYGLNYRILVDTREDPNLWE